MSNQYERLYATMYFVRNYLKDLSYVRKFTNLMEDVANVVTMYDSEFFNPDDEYVIHTVATALDLLNEVIK